MEKNSEQVPGERDKEITVQFDEEAVNEAVQKEQSRDDREGVEGLTPTGSVGLPEAAHDDQLSSEASEETGYRQTSDMNSPGDSQSEDEGVSGGAYAQDERGEGVESLPTWDVAPGDEGTENSERVNGR
jgi:hypothetical protein